jgi:NAD(P)-dependent dehydrogenase (short-subunit alcohol dehydrogenase family)
LHSDVAPLVCDTSDAASVDIAARALEALDVSILVNNAGIGGPVSPLVDIDPEAWDAVFAVNVRGVYLMCRALLPGMIARGSGDVINLASVLGKRPMAARTAYAASKAAVIALTASLAFEVGPHGVRLNTLSPGPVDGQRMERNFRLESERRNIPYEQAQQEYVSRAAAQRMVTEAEVAAAAVAMLGMTGLNGADVDLSAGMVA